MPTASGQSSDTQSDDENRATCQHDAWSVIGCEKTPSSYRSSRGCLPPNPSAWRGAGCMRLIAPSPTQMSGAGCGRSCCLDWRRRAQRLQRPQSPRLVSDPARTTRRVDSVTKVSTVHQRKIAPSVTSARLHVQLRCERSLGACRRLGVSASHSEFERTDSAAVLGTRSRAPLETVHAIGRLGPSLDSCPLAHRCSVR